VKNTTRCQFRPGDLIQIWDHRFENGDDENEFSLKLKEHGELGYVVGFGIDSKDRGNEKILRIMCFGTGANNVGQVTVVNVDWIRRVEKSSDIRKVKSDK